MAEEIRPPLKIDRREIAPDYFGLFELSTDEQLAKKIYEATGDKTFKGFLPLSWNTAAITQMRDVYDTLKKAGTLTAFNMMLKAPEISQRAHQYFIDNVSKIKGILDSPADILDPLKKAGTAILWIAGIGAGAFLLSQLTKLIPKKGA